MPEVDARRKALNLFDEDPLLSRFEMPLKRLYYPFGFPVEVTTNSEEVLIAAEESWGDFRQAFFVPHVELQIGVLEGSRDDPRSVPVVRSQGHLLVTIGGVEDFACCDMNRGFGFAWLAAATASNSAYLRYYYLDLMAYSMLESLYLTPIHAAGVALDGRGLLLCGDSGAGKSSIAYACARRGWTYISDDVSYLIRNSPTAKVIVGNPHLIRLRDSAPTLFPELGDQDIVVRAHGDRVIELATAKYTDLLTAPHSNVDCIIFLKRGPGTPPSFSFFAKERAQSWFERVVCMGEENLRAAHTTSLRQLLSCEILEFHYSDLDSAVTKLSSFVHSLQRPREVKELSVRQANG